MEVDFRGVRFAVDLLNLGTFLLLSLGMFLLLSLRMFLVIVLKCSYCLV